ncbi:receptor-like protein EIX1 [Solanum stenotomum]|uniref:receptor-like protein EIX1 n=1 Tax=Solanum stenotomum TaxID=172797 RepID=UPI0020D18839|nr:receptor-like protein EIX1 [Solanum stenotomum]
MALSMNILHLTHFFMFFLFTFLYTLNISFISCHNNLNVSCIKIEKEALLNLKKGLIDPSSRLSSWIGDECCKWEGIVCHKKTRNVIKIKLRNTFNRVDDVGDGYQSYELGGVISPSLLDLKSLRYLDLSSNNFGGNQIPKFFGSFRKLRYLNLSNAGFGGPVPPHIGNLSRLHFLDLSSYSINEPFANNLKWLIGLQSLKYLNLGSVDLSKVKNHWLQSVDMIPSLLELHLPQCMLSNLPLSFEFFNLSSLLVLDLSNNGFSSLFPSWLSKLGKLAYLDLNSNVLRGAIPIELANMTSLQTLDLYGNSFLEGQLHEQLGNLCNLRELDLSLNNFTGDITKFIDGLSRCNESKLERLNLGYNAGLGGTLPHSIGFLKNLKYIELWKNSFVGMIPDSIGNLSSLEYLILVWNQMSGQIPVTLGKLSKLVVLDLFENNWWGVITEAHFTNLTSLKELYISSNSLPPSPPLVANVDTEWIPPFSLQYLKFRSCRFGPKFPMWIRHFTELQTLTFRRAGFSDTLPDWLWEMNWELEELDFGYNQLKGRVPTTLKFKPGSTVYLMSNLFEGPIPSWSSNVASISLSNNSFSGPVPFDIGYRYPDLTDLDLSQNSLNGTIPLSISKITNLVTLVLSNNHLTGEIPDFWDEVPILYTLDLSNNSFIGRVPSTLSTLNSLRFLMLSNNHLSGEFPLGFQNFSSMITLDLGNNQFSGELPSWIGEKMPVLLALSLQSNMFKGEIPREFCNMTSLHFIDVGSNNLSGKIPSCFGNLKGMTLDPESQRYEGQLNVFSKGRDLLYKDNLYLVNGIILSGNHLTGELPEELTNLSRMNTLNLSMNHLSGKIPEEIERLRQLETLDLSRNEIHGTIPAGMTSLTLLTHLNLSHNHLSGRVPTANQFNTFNDPSIYTGNPDLCGDPLQNKCKDETEEEPDLHQDPPYHSSPSEFGEMGFFVSIGVGFVVGFWGVCAILIIKSSWRHAYFQFVGYLGDKFFVIFILPCASWRRSRS